MTFSEIKLYYHALLIQSAKVDDQVDFDFSVVVYIELMIYFDQCGSNTWVFCLRLSFEPLKKMNELLISRSSSCPFADRISSKHPQHIHLPEMQHRVESLFLCLLWGAKVFLESEALLFSWEMVWKLKKVLVHVKLSKEVKANNNNKQEMFGQVKGHDLAAKGLQQLLPFPRFFELCSPGVDVFCKIPFPHTSQVRQVQQE